MRKPGIRWNVDYSDTELTISLNALPGDINLDGTVDRADVTDFVSHIGQSAGSDWIAGDFDLDRATTLQDLAHLSRNIGTTIAPAPGAEAVPEPSTMLLLLIGAVSIAGRWRRRRHAA